MIKKAGIVLVFLFSLILALNSAYAAIAEHVVISEVKTNTSGEDEFVELYNPTSFDVQLDGWKLTRNNSAGTFANLVSSFPVGSTIPSHGYFLIAHQDYTGLVTSDINYSANNPITNDYAVLLYNSSGSLIDKVGFGSCPEYEGTATSNPPANQSIERISSLTNNELEGNGWDTDNNSADFITRDSPQPQNSGNTTEWDATAPIFLSWNNPSANNTDIARVFNINISLNDSRSPINIVLVSFNNTNYTMNNETKYEWNYSWNTALNQDGHYNITIYYNDTYGNSGSSILYNISIDNTPPTIILVTPENNSFVNNGKQEIGFNITDLISEVKTSSINSSTFRYKFSGLQSNLAVPSITFTQITNGYYVNGTFDLELNEVMVNISVDAEDNSGNAIQTYKWSYTIDLTPPELISTSLNYSNNLVGVSDSINITVNTADLASGTANVTIGNSTIIEMTSTSSDSVWQVITDAAALGCPTDGLCTLHFDLTDNVGNINHSETMSITVDSSAPYYQNYGYSPTTIYNTHNVTLWAQWNDTNGISLVYIQHNASGSWQNITASNNGINYSISIDYSLIDNQETISWKSIAKDNVGIWNTSMSIQTFTISNRVPYPYSTIPNWTWNEDTVNNTLNLSYYFRDYDSDSLSYVAVSQPNNITASINNNTGIVTFTPDADFAGTRNITFNATDSYSWNWSNSVVLTVIAVNDPPVITPAIPNIAFNEDSYNNTVDLDNYVTDIDTHSSNLTWTAITSSNITASINPTTNVLNISAAGNWGGTTSIILKVSDGLQYDQQPIIITVNPVNDAPSTPKLSHPANNSVVYANSTLLKWSASIDAENNATTYYLFIGNSSTQYFNLSTALNYTNLTNLQHGMLYYWHIIAGDAENNATQTTTYRFNISPNNAPQIYNFTPTDTTPTLAENSSLNFTAFITDIDSGTLTYNWSVNGTTNTTGSTTTNNTISFTYSTDLNSAGSKTILLTIKDAHLNTASQSWALTITNLNLAPTLTAITNKTIKEDSTLTFNITASDPDGDTLTYSCNLTALTITKQNNSLATVSWTPTNSHVGNNSITCNVTDATLSDSKSFMITVNNTNDAPTISTYYPLNTNPKIADLTGSQLFNITGSDIDAGDTLTTTWYLNSIQNTTGTSYTATSLSAGNYNITAVISDTTESVSRYWNLTVSTAPLSNLYSGTILSQSNLTNATEVTINHSTHGSIDFRNQSLNLDDVVDLDNYINISNGIIGIDTSVFPSLNKSAAITMKGLAYTSTPIIYYNEGFSLTGTTVCPSTICSNIIYSSSTGILTFNVAHFSIFWTIANASNQPPTITSTAKTTATEFREYSYDVDATDVDNDTITYLLTAYPAGMSISSSSGLITWTPNSTGTFNTTVIATDGNYNTTQSFNIIVSEGSRILISKVDVKVDGKSDKDLNDGDTINKEAEPESDIQFKIEIESLYSDDDDLDIENIEVTVTIRDIDDGDDLEEESKEFDLKPEKDKRVTLDFKLPLELDEDTYEIEIRVEGEDENNTDQEASFTLYLDVEKKSHEIRVKRAYLSPSEISCQRTVKLETTIINTGNKDEDDVSLKIENTQLNINKPIEDIELDEGTSDNTYDFTYYFDISDDIKAGTYPISIKTYYDSKLSGYDTVNLIVKDCVVEKEAKQEHIVTVKKADENITAMPAAKPVEKKVTEIIFRESSSYLMLLVLLYILIISLGILMIAYLIKTKKR